MQKNQKISLKVKYKKVIELALIVSLGFHVFLFTAFKSFEPDVEIRKPIIPPLVLDDVILLPETPKPPPKPDRPEIPLASDDPLLEPDATIEPLDPIDFKNTSSPPPPPEPVEEESPPFPIWDEDPYPIGGYDNFYKHVKYPEFALRTNMQGTVVLQIVIDEKGNVLEYEVLKSARKILDDAAIQAIKSAKWAPAKQRDRAVKVRISIPITFRLN